MACQASRLDVLKYQSNPCHHEAGMPGFHIANHINRNTTSAMIRLLYVSASRSTADALKNDLSDILESSKKNNQALGLTGILVHGGGMFMQVLEGPDHQIFRKYSEILDDRRHADCRIVLITTTEERAFPDWAMAVLEISNHEFKGIQEIIASHQETVDVKAFSLVIRSFMSRLAGK